MDEKLTFHQQICTRENWSSVLVQMPEPGEFIAFKNFRHCGENPFVIYADFESILERIEQNEGHSKYYQEHKPAAIAALLVSTVEEVNNQLFYACGEDCTEQFMRRLITWEERAVWYMQQDLPMEPLGPTQQAKYESAQVCWICEEAFDENDINRKKVLHRDLYHRTTIRLSIGS
jgi:hypothetical protein